MIQASLALAAPIIAEGNSLPLARKSLTHVNFCELFSRELFGTFIHDIYICIEFVRFVSKAFLPIHE